MIQNFDKTFKYIDLHEDFLTSFDENKICKKFLFALGKDDFLDYLSRAIFFQIEREKKGFFEYSENFVDFLIKKIKTPTANLLFLVILNYCFGFVENENFMKKSQEKSGSQLFAKIDKLLKIDQIKNSTLYINILIICKSILKNIIFHFQDNMMDCIPFFDELFKIKNYIENLKVKGALEYEIKKEFLTKNLANGKTMDQIMQKIKNNRNFNELFENLDFSKNINLLFETIKSEPNEKTLGLLLKNFQNYLLCNFDNIKEFPISILKKKIKKICFKIENKQFDDFIKKVLNSVKDEIDLIQEKNNRFYKLINFLSIFCFDEDLKKNIQNNLIECNLINFNITEETFELYLKLVKILGVPFLIDFTEILKIIIQNKFVLTLHQRCLLVKLMNSYDKKILNSNEIFRDFVHKYFSIDYLINYKVESQKFVKWSVEIFLFNFNLMAPDHKKSFLFFTKIITYFYSLNRKDIFEDKIIPSISTLFLSIYLDLEIEIVEDLQKFLLIHSKINEIFAITLLKSEKTVLNLKFIVILFFIFTQKSNFN